MKRPTKDEYYLNKALATAKRSTCIKRHYGAVIVKDDYELSTGYNGSPRGCVNCSDINTCQRGEQPKGINYDNCVAVHAEQNALIIADGRLLQGATLYLACEEQKNVCKFVCDPEHCHGDCSKECECYSLRWVQILNPLPCVHCMRMIKNARIERIVTIAETILIKQGD